VLASCGRFGGRRRLRDCGAVADPVLEKRERMRRLASAGSRVGYLALLVAIVAFVVGMLNDLPSWSVSVVVAGFAVATACLVPSIILGYAVKAAAREDRERERPA
jgi:Na+(H+)/acetate symporter ActP